jgi:hypothetical protein
MIPNSPTQSPSTIVQVPSITQETSTSNKSSNKFKKFIPLILIVILVIALAIYTILLPSPKNQKMHITNTQVINKPIYQSQQLPNQIQNSPTKTAVAINSQCSSIKPNNNYPGWVSYQDPSTCITFAYPSDWKLNVNLKTFDLIKDGFNILIGIGVGDSPVEVLSAKSENVQFLGKTLKSIYTYSNNNACTNFGDNNPVASPVPSLCSSLFDTIFLTESSCLNGPTCTGASWPIFVSWQFKPTRPIPAGIFIQFTTPSPMSLSASTSNSYVNDYYKVISTVNLPSVINFN